ncbi:MAG: hypothetical protein KJ955_01965 [Nanoarchaeota archaeon]|nr:hypothetical protein [Nanoarchaeota archaeon]
MLSEKRIKEAETNARTYFKEGLLKKDKNETAKEMYVKNSNMSLWIAEKVLALEGGLYPPYLWVIVIAYYSMYYIANAVILEMGYKVGDKISHKVTGDALIVFVREKLKKELLEEYEAEKEQAMGIIAAEADLLIESFENERTKRSILQYRMDEEAKQSRALTSLARAKRFSFELKKLIT